MGAGATTVDTSAIDVIARLRGQRADRVTELEGIIAKASAEDRVKLSDSEQARFDALAGRQGSDGVEAVAGEIKELDARITELLDAEERNVDAAAGVERLAPYGSAALVGFEPTTYERGGDFSYFRDLMASNPAFQLRGQAQAQERLQRHMEETRIEAGRRVRQGQREYRDLTRTDTTSVGEFVPPLWLIDEYGKFLRAARITADLCTRLPLPDGTDSINIPRLTTGTAVAAQTADNAAVQKTDAVSATVTAPVRTIAGQQDMAIQVLEQSPIAFDEVIFMDLAADYAAKLDVQVLNGTGANGQVLGINPLVAGSATSIAYTDASPTLPELYPFVAQVESKVAGTRFLPPTAIVMHPRRWYWMTSILDTTNRPLVVPTVGGPFNAEGVVADVQAQGPVGFGWGLPIYVDPNIPVLLTNGAGAAGTEDVIIVGRFSDALLFEGTPRMRTLPEVLSNTLEVRLQFYNYVAFTAGRYPPGFGRVFDTGMAAPSGF